MQPVYGVQMLTRLCSRGDESLTRVDIFLLHQWLQDGKTAVLCRFTKVAKVTGFSPGARRVIDLGHREILVIRDQDQYFAISNICTCPGFVVGHHRPGDEEDPLTHGGRLARLEPGKVISGTIRCPAHQTIYDLSTGRPIEGMAEIALSTFETQIVDDLLMVSQLSVNEKCLGGR